MGFIDSLTNALTITPYSTPATKQGDPKRVMATGIRRMANASSVTKQRFASDNQANAEVLAVTSAWVYSDITLITNRTSETTMAVEERQGEETVGIENHDFERLLDSPNSLMDGAFLRTYLWFWWLLRGQAFVFVSTPGIGQGEPEELWPLPANMITPVPESLRQGRGQFRNRQVIDYQYTPDNKDKPEALPGENVVHFRFPNPWDFWQGLSPLTAGFLPVQTDRAQAEWLKDWYGENNAHPAYVASVPSELSDREFEVARTDFFEKFRDGVGTAFTRAGDLSIEVVQQTIEQMQLLELRKFAEKEIDAIYGVPAGIKGESLSGDSRQAAETLFAKNTIQPLLNKEARAWTSAVVRPYYGDELVASADDIVPRDKALQVQEYNTFSPDRTIAENRAEQNLGDLDDLPEGIRQIIETVPTRLIDPLTQTGRLFALDGSMLTPPQNGSGGNADNGPDVGAMPGVDAPENVAAREATRGVAGIFHAPDPGAVVDEALRTELKRWRKVATRVAADGDNPAEREFTSDVIPPPLHAQIVDALDGADTAGVKAVFEDALAAHPTSAVKQGPDGGLSKEEAEALVSDFEGEFAGIFDEVAGDFPRRIAEADDDSEREELIAALLLLLTTRMRDRLRDMYVTMWQRTTGSAPTGTALAEIERMLDEKEQFIENSLAPDVAEKVRAQTRTVLEGGAASAGGDAEVPGADDVASQIRDALNSFTSRIGMYAGGAWTVFQRAKTFEVRKEAPQALARWTGPNDNATCSPCAAEMNAGERPVAEVPMPGALICEGLDNCRHDIELLNPATGKWESAIAADVVDAILAEQV